MEEHRSEVEKALKSLQELATHEKLLNPAPVDGYRNQLRKRWEAVCQEVSVHIHFREEEKISLSLSLTHSHILG